MRHRDAIPGSVRPPQNSPPLSQTQESSRSAHSCAPRLVSVCLHSQLLQGRANTSTALPVRRSFEKDLSSPACQLVGPIKPKPLLPRSFFITYYAFICISLHRASTSMADAAVKLSGKCRKYICRLVRLKQRSDMLSLSEIGSIQARYPGTAQLRFPLLHDKLKHIDIG